MALRNLPENSLYDLLPAGVIDLDQRKLIQALLGGMQDRVSDLRSYLGHFQDFNNPAAALPTLEANVIFAVYTTDAGMPVTVSLDFQDDTPDTTDEDALRTWAAAQLKVDEDQIGAVFAGTDTLRSVSVEILSMLAANLGATLYGTWGSEDATAIATRASAQQILKAWFPSLKIKGTAQSFSVLGRLLGFADVATVPLWTRLSPRVPQDIGSASNDADFAGAGDQTPTPVLPDPTYSPQEFFDGPYYTWESPRLVTDTASENYYLEAVNRRNPFIKLVQLAGTIDHPYPATYELSGGAPNKKATVALAYGTNDSHMLAEALMEGDAYNGLQIIVTDSFGTAREMEITDQLSLIKYRASWMDLAIGLTNIGTQAVQPNEDLAEDPDLIGTTAEAPYRPWSGGERGFAVTTWPDVSVVDLGEVSPRIQAAGSETQLDPTAFTEALTVAEALESVRPATRQIRSRGVGPFFSDAAGYAAVPERVVLFSGDGVGTISDTIDIWARPEGEFTAEVTAELGTNSTAIYTDLAGTVVSFAGEGFAGNLDFGNATYLVITSGAFASSGTITAEMVPVSTEIIRDEPPLSAKESGTISYQHRPEDEADFSAGTLSLYDEYPWRRPLLATGGDDVDTNYYLPAQPDLDLKLSTLPAQVLGVDGVMRDVYVMAAPITPVPYRYRVSAPASMDEVTGDALDVPFHPPLSAISAGTQYPVVWVEPAILAKPVWDAMAERLALWIPFNEHPVSKRFVSGHGYSSLTVLGLGHTQRLWDATFGWYLNLVAGTVVSVVRGDEPGTVYTLALYLKTSATSALQTVFSMDDGSVTLVIDGTNLQATHTRIGTTALTLTLPFSNDTWQFVILRRDGDSIELGVGSKLSAITWNSTTDADLNSPANETITFYGGLKDVAVHNFLLWTDAHSNPSLEELRSPTFTPIEVPFPTPWVETGAGDGRFAFALLESGFAYPQGMDLIANGSRPGYPQRYDRQGRYHGDPRFEQVGLGDGYKPQPLYQLGLQGAGVEGDGRVLIEGSNPALGWNDEFSTTVGQFVRVTPPYTDAGGATSIGTESPAPSTWPSLQETTNPATNFAYIEGDTGSVYRIWIDDEGAGPTLVAESVVRARPALEQENGVSPPNRDEPTDFHSVLSIPGVILSVVDSGTLATPYAKSDGTVTRTSPPLYLYRNSIITVDAPDAYLRWSNPNAAGQAISTATRDTAGLLSFANTETLAAGNYEIAFDVGNIGIVDADFEGFAVTASLSTGMAGALAQVSGLLLPEGSGSDPRSTTSLVITLEAPITGNSLLLVNWTNPASDPAKGQKRQIAIYGYTLRRLTTALYEVGLTPGLSLTAVDMGGTLPPGGLYGEVNSYGTIGEIVHEALEYPEGSAYPLSSLLTTSTGRKRESLRLYTPYLLPDPSAPVSPSLGTFSFDEVLYQFGDSAQVEVQVLAGADLSFVWNWWDGTSDVTDVASVTKVVSAGTTPFTITVTAVNAVGVSDDATSDLPVNEPPTVVVNADPTFDVFPYWGTLEGTISDPEAGTVDAAWYVDGSIVASGTTYADFFTEPTTVTLRVIDADGGITERTTVMSGLGNNPPEVSPIVSVNQISVPTNATSKATYSQIQGVAAFDSLNGFTVGAIAQDADGQTITAVMTLPSTVAIPADVTLTLFVNAIAVDAETSNGVQTAITLTAMISGDTPVVTVVASRTAATIQVAQIQVSGTGALRFYNGSVRARADGEEIEAPDGYGLQLTGFGGVPSGLIAEMRLRKVSDISYATSPDFSWDFVGNTTSNPRLLFPAGSSFTATAQANGTISDDMLLDFESYDVAAPSVSITLAAIARDPENRGLTFMWTFWDGSTAAGVTQNIAYSNAFYNEVTASIAASTPGLKTVSLTVTDGHAFQTTLVKNITLIANRVPIINDIYVEVDSVLAGQPAVFIVDATDADGDTLSSVWTFTNPRALSLAGGAVQYVTQTSDIGQLVQGAVVVEDGNGGTAFDTPPVVLVCATKLADLQAAFVAGYYSTGINQTFTAPPNSIVRYSLDGTAIRSVTDGLSYVGPFTMFISGGGSMTLKARAFSTIPGVAASDLLEGEFVFFNPT